MKNFNLLTNGEIETLILGALYLAGDKGMTESELEKVCAWADNVKCEHALLENALRSHIGLRIKGGKAEFQILPKGLTEAKKLLSNSN